MDTQFLTMFVLAFITGVSLKKTPAKDTAPKIINRMAWLFLAVLAAETFSKQPPSPSYLILGVLFLLFVTGIAFVFRGFNQTDSSDYLAIASSTFGGGNRGFALIAVVSAWQIFSEQQGKDMIAAFLQIDVIVLAWLMFVIPTLLAHKNKSQTVTFHDSIKSFANDVGATPLLVLIIVLMSWMLPDFLKSYITKFLEPSHSARSAMLLYLSLTYVFVMTTLAQKSIGEVVKTLLLFYAPRWIAAAAVVLVAMIVFGKTFLSAIFDYPVILPVLVFAFCPPSNGLNSFLESFNTPKDRIAEISDLNIVTTMLFAIVLLTATILGPSIASAFVH